MTETISQPRSATDIFMNLIVAFLAPMFLTAASGDVNFARAAAIQTVDAYRAETKADLLLVAQIIAFGLAALASLSLSVADTVSVPMALRLRSSAVAANRASEQCRRAIEQHRQTPPRARLPEAAQSDPQTPPPLEPKITELSADDLAVIAIAEQTRRRAAEANARFLTTSDPASLDPVSLEPACPASTIAPTINQSAPTEPTTTQSAPIQSAPIQPTTEQPAPAQPATSEPATSQAPTPQPAPPSAPPSLATDQHDRRTLWAGAMANVAAKVTANLASLPPAERRAASMRAAALSSVANNLLTGSDGQMPLPFKPQRPNQPD